MFICSCVRLHCYADCLSSICKVCSSNFCRCSSNFVQGIFFKFRCICDMRTYYCRARACPRRPLSILYAPLFHNQQVRPSYDHMIMCSYVHTFTCSCSRLHCCAVCLSSMRKVCSSNFCRSSSNFVQGVFFKFRYICHMRTYYCSARACPRRSLSILYAPLFHDQQASLV